MKKLLTLLCCTLFSVTLLIGCDNRQAKNETENNVHPKSPEEIKRDESIELLNDISGVWSDGSSLVTIYYHDGLMQFIAKDTPILVKIGDIDTENKTVNLLVTKKSDNEEAILTVKKKENVDGSSFTLLITSFVDGSMQEFSFVRKVGADDKNRINNIYKKAQQAHDALVAQQAEQLPTEEVYSQPAEEQNTTKPSDETESTSSVNQDQVNPQTSVEEHSNLE